MAITQPLLKALVKISRRVNEVENFCISAPGWLLFASKMCFQQTIKFFTMQNWHSPFYCSQYHGIRKFHTSKLWTFVKQEFLYERFVIPMSEKMRKVLVSLAIDQKHSTGFASKFVKQIFSDLTHFLFSMALIIFALVYSYSIR